MGICSNRCSAGESTEEIQQYFKENEEKLKELTKEINEAISKE